MARLRVWATKEEVALISRAARKQGITVNQFLRQTLKKSLLSKRYLRNRATGNHHAEQPEL